MPVAVTDPTPIVADPPDMGDPTPAHEPATDSAAEVEKWKALSRKNEEKAKANAQKAKDYDALVASQMTEQEKAVAEARAAGRSEALIEIGARLVAAKVEAIAAGRIEAERLTALIGSLDTSKLLTQEGEPDADKITALIESVLPAKDDGKTWPDMGQGTRGKSAPTTSDPLMAALASKVGVKP